MTLKEAYEYIERETEFVAGYNNAIQEYMITKRKGRIAVCKTCHKNIHGK